MQAGFLDQGHQRVEVDAQATGLSKHRPDVLLGELLAAPGPKLLPRAGDDEHPDAAPLFQHRLVHQHVDALRSGGWVNPVEGGELVRGRYPRALSQYAVDDVIRQLLGYLHEQRRPVVQRGQRPSWFGSSVVHYLSNVPTRRRLVKRPHQSATPGGYSGGVVAPAARQITRLRLKGSSRIRCSAISYPDSSARAAANTNTTSCRSAPPQSKMFSSTPSRRKFASTWPISSASSRCTASSAYSPYSTWPPSGRWNAAPTGLTSSDTSRAPSRGLRMTAIALTVCERPVARARPAMPARLSGRGGGRAESQPIVEPGPRPKTTHTWPRANRMRWPFGKTNFVALYRLRRDHW